MTDDLSVDDLLAIVAHDLKSPLSAVRGYIELVQQAGELNDLQAQYSKRAMAGLERMEHLIFSLLEMSRLDNHELTLELGDCDLGRIAESAVNMVENSAEERQITIELEIEDHLASVHGDAHLLSQVLNNLCMNAIKYNHEGGSIWIRVSNQPDFVRVDVRDNGVGIPADDQPYVFDRFFRAKNSAAARASGSGLGLAIVKVIIQKHNGYVWLKSVEGEGSTFSFTLPRKDQMSEGRDQLSEDTFSAGEGRDQVGQQPYHEPSIEEDDAVDDNTQESRGVSETDSTSDAV